MGKHAIYDETKECSSEVQAVVKVILKLSISIRMLLKAQVKYGRGTESTIVFKFNNSLLQFMKNLLRSLVILLVLTEIVLQLLKLKLQAKVNSVQTGLQESIAGIGNYLNKKIEDVSDNVHSQLNRVTKHVSVAQ